MSIMSIVLLGIGLSMDAFAVSLANGIVMKKTALLKNAMYLGFFFGLFQAMMPLLGWLIGSYFQAFITSIDHWIAFGLLSIIGLNMIREARHSQEEKKETSLTLKTVLILAIATSIDAFAVGISFAFLKVDILSAITIIGIITFVLSFAAVYIGNKLGNLLQHYAEILGGCILILLGLKILVEHLFIG